VLVAAASLVGCPIGQSAHCGDEYVRNMTRVKSGWYALDPVSDDAADPLSGGGEIRLEKDPAAQAIGIHPRRTGGAVPGVALTTGRTERSRILVAGHCVWTTVRRRFQRANNVQLPMNRSSIVPARRNSPA